MLKTGIPVVKLHKNNIHAKFLSNIFIIGCAMVKKKQIKVMTSHFFETQFLAFLIAVRENKWHFLVS